ncbi:MAG: AMP-binding protein [Planctomycetes bacterium]|nr:AMP-binding protein [Planctomycetota bacterium]
MTCGTLHEVLLRAASAHASRGFSVYDGRGRNIDRRTYPQILEHVRATAARLAAAGIERGDRVLICLPTSWNWLDLWLVALWRGALPVALAPMGNMAASESYLQKAEGVVERLGAKRLFAETALREEALKRGARATAAALMTPDEFAAVKPGGPIEPPQAGSTETAFLQLTSGSTGLQRAVMISHRAAIHNPLAIDEAVRASLGRPARDAIEGVVSWLPLYHDMGLVGGMLFSLLHGYEFNLMRPETFLGRPRLWLEALSKRRGVLSAAPNFAYQACVERLDPADLEGVDLSNWKGAMTGAEMIRPETCAAFSEKFARRGFDGKAFRPCYGLAEGTLAVTVDLKGQGIRTQPLPKGADAGLGLNRTVSTGAPILDTEVRIAAPDGSILPEGAIGQVRIKGPSVFSGYYQDPQATAEALQNGWLCTGDLGFLKDEELYITGRTKDLLIVHGHNLMPHELEWFAESATGGGGTSRAAAFSVATGAEGEQAILVVEVEARNPGGLPALEHEIRSRIGRTLGLPLAEVVFVRRGAIPKTTSGKVQRAELRQRYLEGKIERLA